MINCLVFFIFILIILFIISVIIPVEIKWKEKYLKRCYEIKKVKNIKVRTINKNDAPDLPEYETKKNKKGYIVLERERIEYLPILILLCHYCLGHDIKKIIYRQYGSLYDRQNNIFYG